MKTALLFGASGLVGSHILKLLLDDPAYAKLTIVVRRPLSVRHDKLHMLIGDPDSLPGLQDELACDDVFIALGTTKAKTPDQQAYYRIDHDYPVLAARLARERGATSVFLVSAVGADPSSRIFYVRTKGETERDILALGYPHTHIFRPSLITGNRGERRPLEKTFGVIWKVLNPLLAGSMKRYRGMDGADIARAMHRAAGLPATKETVIYYWQDMDVLLRA